MLGFFNVDTQEQVFPAGSFIEIVPIAYTADVADLSVFVQFNDQQTYNDFVQTIQDTALRQYRCAFGTIERQGVNLYVIDTALWDDEKLSCIVQMRPVGRFTDLPLSAPSGNLVVDRSFAFYDYRTTEQVFVPIAQVAVQVAQGWLGYGSTWYVLLFYPDGNSANDLTVLDRLHKSRRVLRLHHSNLYPFTVSAITAHEDGRRVTLTLAPVFRSRVG